MLPTFPTSTTAFASPLLLRHLHLSRRQHCPRCLPPHHRHQCLHQCLHHHHRLVASSSQKIELPHVLLAKKSSAPTAPFVIKGTIAQVESSLLAQRVLGTTRRVPWGWRTVLRALLVAVPAIQEAMPSSLTVGGILLLHQCLEATNVRASARALAAQTSSATRVAHEATMGSSAEHVTTVTTAVTPYAFHARQ